MSPDTAWRHSTGSSPAQKAPQELSSLGLCLQRQNQSWMHPVQDKSHAKGGLGSAEPTAPSPVARCSLVVATVCELCTCFLTLTLIFGEHNQWLRC